MNDRAAEFACEHRSVSLPSHPRPSLQATCNRCGFAVSTSPLGCKNPCRNCGTVYPLGDCSD